MLSRKRYKNRLRRILGKRFILQLARTNRKHESIFFADNCIERIIAFALKIRSKKLGIG
jgi:hypothetical protein